MKLNYNGFEISGGGAKLMFGTTQVKKVYHGTELVYQRMSILDTSKLEHETGYISATDGQIVQGGDNATTQFIKNYSSRISLTLKKFNALNSTGKIRFGFYDKDKSFINSEVLADINSKVGIEYFCDVPSNCAYFRFTYTDYQTLDDMEVKLY